MFNLLLFTLVGVGAQLVDGALGMAFGVTATTLLMIGGLGPAQASAAVHLAEVGNHPRFGCVALEVQEHRLEARRQARCARRSRCIHSAQLCSRVCPPKRQSPSRRRSCWPSVSMWHYAFRSAHRPSRTLVPPRTLHVSCPHSACSVGFISMHPAVVVGVRSPPARCSHEERPPPAPLIGSVSASEFLVASAASLGFLVGLGRESAGNLLVVAVSRSAVFIAAPFAAWAGQPRTCNLARNGGGRRHRVDQRTEAVQILRHHRAVTVAGSWPFSARWQRCCSTRGSGPRSPQPRQKAIYGSPNSLSRPNSPSLAVKRER